MQFATGNYTTTTSPVARMTIRESSGYVGIGTITPEYKLHVKGTIVSQGTQYRTHINNGPSEHTHIRGGKSTSNVYINEVNSSGNVYIGGQGAKLYVRLNGTENLRIDHNQILTSRTDRLYLNHGNKADVNICQDGVVVKSSGMLVANSVNYNYDQIWRTSGKLYIQYSSAYNLDLCDGGGMVGCYGGTSKSWNGYYKDGASYSPHLPHNGYSTIGLWVTQGCVANWVGAQSDRRIKKT